MSLLYVFLSGIFTLNVLQDMLCPHTPDIVDSATEDSATVDSATVDSATVDSATVDLATADSATGHSATEDWAMDTEPVMQPIMDKLDIQVPIIVNPSVHK